MITEQGRILELLLSGAFICQISDEEAWRFLKTSGNSDKIETQLNVLNRTLASAAEGDVFFAAYQSLYDNERKQLGGQFQEISSQLMPLVEWLLLVQQANGSDVPVTQGTAIRLNELQTTIEDTPAFAEQLEKISRNRLFGSTSTQLDGQLKLVFNRLTQLGYLLKPNVEKQIFIATGKVEYLYDVLKFIDETEALSLTEQAENAVQQGSLL
ncbi:condensin complex protein MksE [Flavobacterium sp. W21_SRS_FM6]|uniref:condensin complex protein MksE n=1 Tax=Flavobacterium sp. W21_SRS_FM6 TaxID=3240268 RepID=UPI003F92BB25